MVGVCAFSKLPSAIDKKHKSTGSLKSMQTLGQYIDSKGHFAAANNSKKRTNAGFLQW